MAGPDGVGTQGGDGPVILMGVHDTNQLWTRPSGIDMRASTIRAWARENSIPVEPIGRIRADVRMRYVEAMEGRR